MLFKNNTLVTYVNTTLVTLPVLIAPNVSIYSSTPYVISVQFAHALVELQNYGTTLGVSVWMEVNGTKPILTLSGGFCGSTADLLGGSPNVTLKQSVIDSYGQSSMCSLSRPFCSPHALKLITL
jgi:hypothetical protein